jgi:hypothetical protein
MDYSGSVVSSVMVFKLLLCSASNCGCAPPVTEKT